MNDSAERVIRSHAKIVRDLGTQLMGFLNDKNVIEIMLNPDGKIYIDWLGQDMTHEGEMDPNSALALINTVASCHDTTITKEHPVISCELPIDGSRFQASLPPTTRNPTFSIRKRALFIFSLADYVKNGIATTKKVDAIKEAVSNHKNIVIIGGTGSGKTTLANAVIAEISAQFPKERLITIEDTYELQCAAENHLPMRTSDYRTTRDLIHEAMRNNPDRIIVGEVRGSEALDLLKGWNTGHPGGVATVHANSALEGLRRLESLCSENQEAPSTIYMREEIGNAVDLAVFITDTNLNGRRIKEVLEIERYDGEYIFKKVGN